MSVAAMRYHIKQIYTTLRGRPVEQCSDAQISAVYYSMVQRGQIKVEGNNVKYKRYV